ncbi:aminotransferase class I/II-fold pyridoxal phosphate-dependent enzyme [Desulfovibrio sp. OttesenSCG-928-C06]|nr:aminotransferase class I/II-fold pyridoxal phosphate-dependent enzyme [Desulfovibrio sp. OttesenSCG-928-C06]
MQHRTSNISPDKPLSGGPRREGSGNYRQGLHGGEILKAAARIGIAPDKILDFSSNTNIFALSTTERLVRGYNYNYQRYPESGCPALTRAIAKFEGLEPENILCGNGAADLIWLTLRALAPSSVLFLGPVFSEYVRACKALGIQYEIIETSPKEEFACTPEVLSRLWESRPELAIICSPNNPGAIAYSNLGKIMSALRAPRILTDLSYRDFLRGTPEHAAHCWSSLSKMCGRGTEIISLHSFTKFFCCPGIRLGYLVGAPMTIARFAQQAPAWSVSQLAQDMGLAFLEHIEEYDASLAPMRQARYEFGIGLRRLPLFDPELVLEGPNFFCCGISAGYLRAANSATQDLRDYANATPDSSGRIRIGNAGELQSFLLQNGILVRDCDNIPGMPEGFVRIQVRSTADNDRLLEALQRAL